MATYHRLLVWDIEKAPTVTRTADRVLNPLVGKSLVVYLAKARGSPVLAGVAAARVGPPSDRVAVDGRPAFAASASVDGGHPPGGGCVRSIPEVPGVISAAQVMDTARAIAALQRPDGMIPWFPGGHCDPWNHVEAAMALTVAGMDDEADAAYQWLVDTQLPDGSWFNYYLTTGIEDARLDTNVCAYLATGAWHRYVSTGDVDGLERPVAGGRGRRSTSSCAGSGPTGPSLVARRFRLPRGVRPAHRLVVDLPQPPLRHRRRRTAGPRAAGLGAGRRPPGPHPGPPARRLRPQGRVRHGLVLPGAGRRPPRARRPAAGWIVSWDVFVMEGRGVRCVSTGEWVTAAETAECVLALDALGMDDVALTLLTWVQALRNQDGSYWTGMVYPEEATYPPLERSTYTAGAMVLAADALSRTTPASGIFRGEGLPSHLDLTEPAPDAPVEPVLGAPGGPVSG